MNITLCLLFLFRGDCFLDPAAPPEITLYSTRISTFHLTLSTSKSRSDSALPPLSLCNHLYASQQVPLPALQTTQDAGTSPFHRFRQVGKKYRRDFSNASLNGKSRLCCNMVVEWPGRPLCDSRATLHHIFAIIFLQIFALSIINTRLLVHCHD